MCPDRQLLSVYLDGELPSPWKEKMESHLSHCSGCAALLENYRSVSLRPADLDENALLVRAQERVWRNLEAKDGFTVYEAPRFWRRRLSVPLPAAAAAAILVCAVCAVLWTVRPRADTAQPNMAAAPQNYAVEQAAQGFDQGGVMPAANMDEVLRYLGSRDSGDIIILQLPESRNFTSSGEPAIIKAADYSRRNR